MQSHLTWFVWRILRCTLCYQQHKDIKMWKTAVNRTKKGELEQKLGVGEKASHLGAVLKPPEEGQSSDVARPNHRSQINLLPPDGYGGSGEIYAFHWTCGGNRYSATYIVRYTHVGKQNMNSSNTECRCNQSLCTFSSSCAYLPFSKAKTLESVTAVTKMRFSRVATWPSMKGKTSTLWAPAQEWVMMFLIHILVMCKNSVLLSDPWLFSAEAVTR